MLLWRDWQQTMNFLVKILIFLQLIQEPEFIVRMRPLIFGDIQNEEKNQAWGQGYKLLGKNAAECQEHILRGLLLRGKPNPVLEPLERGRGTGCRTGHVQGVRRRSCGMTTEKQLFTDYVSIFTISMTRRLHTRGISELFLIHNAMLLSGKFHFTCTWKLPHHCNLTWALFSIEIWTFLQIINYYLIFVLNMLLAKESNLFSSFLSDC